jgi:hypothetical protein
MSPIIREAVIDRRQPQMRWSAVFAGAVLAIGLWLLLQVLGMGIGLSAVRTDNAGSLRGAGMFTGIWSLIAPLVAVFLGALLTGRLAGAQSRGIGALHGSVMWALTTAIGLWAVVTLVTTMVSGVVRAGGAAIEAASSAVSGGAGGAMSTLGIDANDLVGPINQQLQSQGKPPITAQQLDATLKAVAQRGLHQGRLDREVLVQEVARNTSLTRADAEQVADQIEQRVSTTAGTVGQTAKHIGLEAADTTGKTLLAGGIMLVVTLGAALGGGALGVRGRRRERDREVEHDITRRELRDRDLREREAISRDVRERDDIPPSGAV